MKINHIKFILWVATIALMASCTKDPETPTLGSVVTYRIGGTFSVSDGRRVQFAPGNLQYQATTGLWRFAEHQYDIIGMSNANISSAYDGWIDLFGWGTSGFIVAPYLASVEFQDYTNDNWGSENNYDWGRFNPITNGGNQAGKWRTLTSDEWEYLLSERANAENKFAPALVDNVPGIVILSDYFALPDSCNFAPTFDNGWLSNVYTASLWKKMEAAGAVFLPATGQRFGTEVTLVGEYGAYWSTSFFAPKFANAVGFDNEQISVPLSLCQVFVGNAVRLARVVEGE